MLTLVFHAISIEIFRFLFWSWLIIRSQGLALLFDRDSSPSSSHRETQRDMGMTVGMVFLLWSMNVFNIYKSSSFEKKFM